jgi:hypothetical protein
MDILLSLLAAVWWIPDYRAIPVPKIRRGLFCVSCSISSGKMGGFHKKQAAGPEGEKKQGNNRVKFMKWGTPV